LLRIWFNITKHLGAKNTHNRNNSGASLHFGEDVAADPKIRIAGSSLLGDWPGREDYQGSHWQRVREKEKPAYQKVNFVFSWYFDNFGVCRAEPGGVHRTDGKGPGP
jgi:hypothetical protein